jgi:hypothetical protein
MLNVAQKGTQNGGGFGPSQSPSGKEEEFGGREKRAKKAGVWRVRGLVCFVWFFCFVFSVRRLFGPDKSSWQQRTPAYYPETNREVLLPIFLPHAFVLFVSLG